MHKKVVIFTWIITVGSVLWLLSKAKPESLLLDWLNYLTILVTGVFAGNALANMIKLPSYKPQWKSMSRLIVPFYTGIVCLVCGILFSATEFLGSQWPGFGLAIFGICYYQYVLFRADIYYKQVNT